jgi:hypothetical protein
VKFFTALLSLLSLLVSEWVRSRAKQEGRKDMQEALDANVAKAEAAMDVDDPARLDRLRNRFDRARR